MVPVVPTSIMVFCLRSIKGLKVRFWAHCTIPLIWQKFSWGVGVRGPFLPACVLWGGGGGGGGLGGVGLLFVVSA